VALSWRPAWGISSEIVGPVVVGKRAVVVTLSVAVKTDHMAHKHGGEGQKKGCR
jgi:hypothetical protein